MCAAFSVARPHSHVTYPSKYPHFCLCSMLHVNPVRGRFRHLHVAHGLSCPLARLAHMLTVTLCGVVLSHSLHRMILGDNSAGFTLRRKQLRDFSLLSTGCCPYREWASYALCIHYNTKHITIANIYIPPRDSTSTHYKTAETDIQHCIQHITYIPHSVITRDVNAHSTLWHSCTDDHRGQLIANVISNSDHITLNTNTPTRAPNTTLQQASSPDITTVSNTLYNRTSWKIQHALSSDHLPIITTINIRHDYRLQQNRRTFTNYKKADWTQFMEDTESAFTQTTIHTANIIFTNIILMADKHNIPKGKMHSNCRLLPDHIVFTITQRSNIRRTHTCDPALKLLNEEITSDIQKHKQNIWRKHLDAHCDSQEDRPLFWA